MPTIAFVCVENAGRSQMAAAFARGARRADLVVISGGTRPASSVDSTVVEAMREVGVDLSGEVPKAVGPADLVACDYIVTMGCASEDVCPARFRGDALDWGLPDPKGKSLEQVRAIRDEIERRVRALLETLGP